MLDETFKIKNLGDLTYFLELEVVRTNKGIHLCQWKYTLDLFNDWHACFAPVSTPMDFSFHISSITSEPLTDPYSSRRLIGRLIYLTNTTRKSWNINQFLETKTLLLIRHQFRNHLKIIKTNLETKIFLVSKIVSNLVSITTNYFFVSKNWFLFHDFIVVKYTIWYYSCCSSS